MGRKFEVDNTGKMTATGLKVVTAPVAGYVLESDSDGNATWQYLESSHAGPRGATGLTGHTGSTGSMGHRGIAGYGETGPMGDTGVIGTSNSATGPDGSINAMLLSGGTLSGSLYVQYAAGGTDWTNRTAIPSTWWQSVVYGNGKFVAVGNDQGAYRGTMYSSDGVGWTYGNPPSHGSWMGIAYGDIGGTGTFVAVPLNEQIYPHSLMYSYDGVTFTGATSASFNYWMSVAYGNPGGTGMFAAVGWSGDGNPIMTSYDGVNWDTRVCPESTNEWQSVAYGTPGGTGMFVAVAETGTHRVMVSYDGIDWSPYYAIENNRWQSVAYGNGVFVAVAQSATTHKVMYSYDGIAWTGADAAWDTSWKSVAFGNGGFVAVSANPTDTNQVMTSADGIHWVARTSSENNEWNSVAFGDNTFAAVSVSGTHRVMTSPGPTGGAMSMGKLKVEGITASAGQVLAASDSLGDIAWIPNSGATGSAGVTGAAGGSGIAAYLGATQTFTAPNTFAKATGLTGLGGSLNTLGYQIGGTPILHYFASQNVTAGGQSLGGGSNLVAIGYRAAGSATSGSGNVMIGSLAGDSISLTGSDNIGIGYGTCYNTTTGNNNICMGTLAYPPSAGTSNYLRMPCITGDLSAKMVSIGDGSRPAPTSSLQVANLPAYSSNAAAVSAGLTMGAFYMASSGDPRKVCVVH